MRKPLHSSQLGVSRNSCLDGSHNSPLSAMPPKLTFSIANEPEGWGFYVQIWEGSRPAERLRRIPSLKAAYAAGREHLARFSA
jgi:hypothetical protein